MVTHADEAGAAFDAWAAAFTRSDAQDLDRALHALWEGTLKREVMRATPRAPEAQNDGAV